MVRAGRAEEQSHWDGGGVPVCEGHRGKGRRSGEGAGMSKLGGHGSAIILATKGSLEETENNSRPFFTITKCKTPSVNFSISGFLNI